MKLSEAASIGDLAAMAKRRIPAFVYDFLDGGAGDERGLRRNIDGLAEIILKPRYAAGIKPQTEVSLFWRLWSLPVGIAPVGMGNLVWPGTDIALATLAQEANIPFVLSTAATTSIEDIAEVAPDVTWFQLYVSRNDTINNDLLRRADEAGVKVLVITLDITAPGNRLRDVRNRFVLPFRPGLRMAANLAARPAWSLLTALGGPPGFANYAPYANSGPNGGTLAQFMADQIKSDLDWDDLRRLRECWPHVMVLKGILAPEDAVLARSIGADAVWVSNHGGRQLDSSPASVDALARVREAVGPDLPLFMDGGVRSGEDVAKARVAGADFVFCGRSLYYGAGAGGADGARRALNLLGSDLRRTLEQIGCPSFSSLNHGWSWSRTGLNGATQ